jgi:hypothetical protein
MTGPAIFLVAALLVQGNPAVPTAPRSGLSRELSDSFGKKLEQMEKFEHDPKAKRAPISVFESELNSYVRYALAEKVPRGLRDVRIVLRDGRLELRGVANLSEFQDLKEKAAGAASFLSLLGGDMPVEIVADFKSDRGFGQFDVVSAQVGPVPLSASVLADIVSRATVDASRPNGFDIRAPFRLPYAVRRIRPQQALAIVEY